jgi:hypothetical protein
LTTFTASKTATESPDIQQFWLDYVVKPLLAESFILAVLVGLRELAVLNHPLPVEFPLGPVGHLRGGGIWSFSYEKGEMRRVRWVGHRKLRQGETKMGKQSTINLRNAKFFSNFGEDIVTPRVF